MQHQKNECTNPATAQWGGEEQDISLLRFPSLCPIQLQHQCKTGGSRHTALCRLWPLSQPKVPLRQSDGFWQNGEALCLLLGCFWSLHACQGRSLLAALAFGVPQINHGSEPASVADCACLEWNWGDVSSLLQPEQANKNVLPTPHGFLRAAAC